MWKKSTQPLLFTNACLCVLLDQYSSNENNNTESWHDSITSLSELWCTSGDSIY